MEDPAGASLARGGSGHAAELGVPSVTRSSFATLRIASQRVI